MGKDCLDIRGDTQTWVRGSFAERKEEKEGKVNE